MAASQSVQNAPDVFSIDVEDLPKYVPQLAPAPEELFNQSQTKSENTGKGAADSVKALYQDVVGKTCVLKDNSGNDKVYGLPIAMDSLALYINKSLIDRAVLNIKQNNKISGALSDTELSSVVKKMQQAPKTWTELTQIAPYLTIKEGETITQSAIALGTGTNIERSYDILSSMMLQNGTQMTSQDYGTATFNQSAGQAAGDSIPGLRALNFYLQFADAKSSLYTWNSKMPNDVEAFEQGQVAMIIHYADLYRFLIAEKPSMKSSIDIQPLPQVTDPSSPLANGKLKTIAKMQVEVAPSAKADANRQKAAWSFIKYITSKQGSSSYLSAMKLASPLKESQGSPKFTAFTTEKSWSDLWFKGHKSLEVDQIFIAMIENATSGKFSAKDSLDQSAKDTSTILQAAKNKWAAQNNE
jgi:ABC-type glycerol-3-phosphate transport system substrate-binding protein